MTEPDHAPNAAPPTRHTREGFRRDMRRYASQTNLRLLAGMLVLLMVIGNGLVLIIYGEGAARTSLICMLTFFVPVILIALLLALAGWVSGRRSDD